jgi:hypothetical protein
MPVTPDEWISNGLLAVETVLSNCTEYRTILSAADVAAARDKTCWQDLRALPAPPYGLLIASDGSVGDQALRLPLHNDSIGAYLCWPRQQQSGDTAKDMAIRELNSFGRLLQQIKALVGTGTYLARARLGFELPKRCADNDSDKRDCWDATITFTWEI